MNDFCSCLCVSDPRNLGMLVVQSLSVTVTAVETLDMHVSTHFRKKYAWVSSADSVAHNASRSYHAPERTTQPDGEG